MKLKNLILLSTLVMLFTMFLGTQSTYAATWYVDNLVGNDSWDGQSAVPAGDGIHGPKKTISGGAGAVVGALRAAVAGDIIYVANTGTAYQEGAGLELAGGFTVDKQVTFRGYQSLNPATVSNITVAVTNFTVNITTGTTRTCTFDSGTFTFALTGAPGVFYLQAGTLNDASAPITVGGAATTILVKRSAGAVSATGQFNFAGTIDFEYNGGAAITTGNEFVAAGGTFRNLTTTGAGTALTIGRSVTMTGQLTTAGTVNLSAGTLTVQNAAAVTHTLGNNVTNGTLDFNMSAAAAYTVTVNGAVQINHVKARGNANTLDIAQPTRITGNLLTQGSALVTNSGNSIAVIDGTVKAEGTSFITLGTATATIGTALFNGTEIWNNGKGIITVAPTVVHGNVLLDPAITSGIVNQGEGQVMFNIPAIVPPAVAPIIVINGSVTNSTNFTFPNTDDFANTDPAASTGLARFDGVISFPATTVTINGTVTMGGGAAWSGATTDAAHTYKWNGMIVFNNTTDALTITGSLVNSVVCTISTHDANVMSDCGIIVWPALSSGVIRIDGGISNSSQFTTALAGSTDNGVIDFDYFEAAGTAFGAASHVLGGSYGAALNRIGAIANSSKGNAAGDGNGDIIFAGANAVNNPFFGTSVTVSGTAVGGYTVFANGNFNVNGNVINSRTHASTSLQVGTVATAARTIQIGGYLSNQGTATTSFVLTSTGNVTVTGKLESTANGTIQFPGLTTAGANFGPLNLTNGTIIIPADDAGAPKTSVVNFVGNSNMTGGTLDLTASLANGGGALTFSGNSSSLNLVGGTTIMTNRGAAVGIVSNATTLQIGNGTTNPTFTGVPVFTVSTPSPVGPVTVNIGTLQPIFPGTFNVASSAGITTSVTIQGGLFQPNVLQLNSLGLTNINNAIIYLTQAGNVLINNGGYTTSNNGRIVFAGTAGQNITAPVTPGVFGDIEINNNSVAGVVTGGSLGNFAGTLYLTSGLLDNTIQITMDATTPVNPAPAPNVVGVVVNQGRLTQQPNYVAMVNITYVGLDKATGNEIPNIGTHPTKLNNLTVATTNGAGSDGRGSVRIAQSAIVNGTLTVNAGQFLVINDGPLTLQLNGLANLAGSVANITNGLLVLNGATVNASAYLPSTRIANGTNANTITGVKAFIDGLLGADGVVGGAGGNADYSLAVGGVANGDVAFLGLNGTLSLGVGASPFTSNNSTNLDGITTAGANNVLTLTTNVVDAGTVGLNHVAGNINLGTFNLTTYDATPIIDGTATVTGTGTLVFAGNAPALSVTTQAGTIAANVNVNTNAGTDFSLSTNPLTISGILTLTNGTVTLNQNLTLTNQTFNINSGFDGWLGANTLILNPTVAPMTWNYNIATPNVIKVDVRNNVDLAGSVTTLNVTGVLTLTSGVFNYNTRSLQIDNGAKLTRELGATDGTGTLAGTGALIFNGATVENGTNTPALSASYVRFTGALSTFNGTAAYGSFTVNNTLDINNTTNAVTNVLNGKFTVAANVTVNWTKGKFDAAPNYVTPINLNLVGYTHNDVLDATVWPASMPALVATLRVLGTGAADQVLLPAAGSRTINSATSLYLTSGILNINGTTLNLASGINVYRTDAGSIVGNTLVFPGDNNYNLFYYANGGVIASGIELPAVLNNLTIARTQNANNFATTLGKTVTVNGTLDIKNDITQVAPFFLQANGTINIVRDVTYSLATVPAVNLASFIIGGVNGQTMTLGGNVQFPNLTIDMQTTVTNPVLNVNGSFTMVAGVANRLSFNNGIINMADGILYLPRPTGASNSGLGYVITGTGHVVGNVARTGAANDGQVTDGRFVFPTGSAPDVANARKAYYRPVTLTFNGSYPLQSPTTFIVNHRTVNPEGTVGFENGINGGAGVTIGKYPNFYWGITASPTGLSQTQMYDIEMQGSNLGYPYTTFTKLRGIRRLGNSLDNPWLLITTDGDNNSQQIFGTDTTVWVRSTATQGGIVASESRFTIGIPVIAPGFNVPATSPTAFAGVENTQMSLPYSVATNLLGGPAPTVTCSVNPAIPAAQYQLTQTVVGGQVSGNFVWTPDFTQAGTYTVTITAVDGGGTSSTVYNVTVADLNRAPAATNVTPAQPKVGVPVTITFNGTDADGDPITWNRAFVGATPAGTVTPAVGNVTGNQYVITFTPTYADWHQTYTFRATYTDGKIGAPLTRDVTLQPVIMPYNFGDVNMDGFIQGIDASEALRMSVGLTTSVTTPVFTYGQMNYALADVDGIHNVGNVVTFGAFQYGISAWDAYLILMKSVNPGNTYWGDVAKPAFAKGELALGKTVAKENGLVALPLTVQNAKDIYTVTFELNFDTKVAEVVSLTNTPKDWLTAYSVENGVVKVVMAGATSINASNLGELNLRMKSKEDKVQISGTATINNLESKTLATMTVGSVPSKFALDQNFPNPFNPSTTIKYQIAEPSKVTIAIYSIDGQLVKTLVSDTKDAGYYDVVWNGTNSFGKQVASGMYIYRIDAGNFVSTKKLMLMK